MENMLSPAEIKVVHEILIDTLAVAASQLTPEARIEHDLGADSLDIVEIAMAIDERFHLSTADDQWEKVLTVGDLYEVIARQTHRSH